MSPKRLAEAAGIDRTTLVNIEANRRNPSPETALAIATALKVELVAILADPQPTEPAMSAAHQDLPARVDPAPSGGQVP